jgi:signal transduction histidine kinase
MAQQPSRFFSSLAGKVLALTIVFVMLGEVLIFAPSIANFRLQFLKSRIAQAEIAALAAEAAPDQMLREDLRTEILKGAGVTAVALQRGPTRRLVLRSGETSEVSAQFDLRSAGVYTLFRDALLTMFQREPRVIHVVDKPPNMSGDLIEVSMHEQPLHEAMLAFGLRILGLSIVLSLIVAALVFAVLNRLLVRPIKRISTNMVEFSQAPEDPRRIILPTKRNDEIGRAETELERMQAQLQSLLQQKAHLASLGLAVSKVSHDLRNMLTSAQLVSDRLAEVKDPTVQRVAPKLFTSLDRAIRFLNETLRYGRAQEAPPRKERLVLRDVVQEVTEQIQVPAMVRIDNQVRSTTTIDADREHLNRILTNLVRNACEAFAASRSIMQGLVSLRADATDQGTTVLVSDNGPGIPLAIKDNLFEAFQSAGRPGGTGLGLAIAAELVRAHGGALAVVRTDAQGTEFSVFIPHAVPAGNGNVVPLHRVN